MQTKKENKDTGFGISIEVFSCPEGKGIVIRNELTKMEQII